MNSKTKFAITTILATIMCLVVFLGVLAISQKNHHSFDLTKNQRFTVSPQTISEVQKLDKPVEALVFLLTLDADGNDKARTLLEQYHNAAPDKFTYRIIDPKRDPLTAQKYNVVMPGCAVLVCGERQGRSQSVDEEGITNALMRLADATSKKVYFLTGHGEISAYSTNSEQNMRGLPNMSNFRGDMPNEGYEGANLNLIATKTVPDDAAIVVIPGPSKALMPAEQKALETWIDKGGRVLLSLDTGTENTFDWMLEKYGFTSPQEVIIDEMSQMAGMEPVYAMAMQYNNECSLVKDFAVNTVFKLARPVAPAPKLPEGAKVYGVASTGPNAFTLRWSDLKNEKQMKITADKIASKGSVCLVAAGTYPVADANATSKKDEKAASDKDEASGKEKHPETRILVVGDSDFYCNELYHAAGNRDLALNMLNWLSASEDKITIHAKESLSNEPLILPAKQAADIKALLIGVIPLGLLGVGIVQYKRRH